MTAETLEALVPANRRDEETITQFTRVVSLCPLDEAVRVLAGAVGDRPELAARLCRALQEKFGPS